MGHGGALRGWRSHRIYLPEARLSVVVMFNHLSDAYAAALSVLTAALGETPPSPPTLTEPEWLGAYLDPETGLSVRIDRASPHQVRLRFGHSAERLELQADGSAASGAMRVYRAADGVWMERPQDNQTSRLTPLEVDEPERASPSGFDVAGLYHCDELNAALTVVDAGGALYGGFSGVLGHSRMEQLDRISRDVWALPCPRALDHTPPGDWTLAFQRDGVRRIDGVKVGCWLARGLNYRRVL